MFVRVNKFASGMCRFIHLFPLFHLLSLCHILPAHIFISPPSLCVILLKKQFLVSDLLSVQQCSIACLCFLCSIRHFPPVYHAFFKVFFSPDIQYCNITDSWSIQSLPQSPAYKSYPRVSVIYRNCSE